MNILITTGTTHFETLVKTAVTKFSTSSFNYTIQSPCVKNIIPISNNIVTYTFLRDIEEYYRNADLVITHAGAGSVYKLLELRKKIIVIPNLDRIDKHQLDLADFVHSNRYAKVIYDTQILSHDLISEVLTEDFALFLKDEFFAIDKVFGRI